MTCHRCGRHVQTLGALANLALAPRLPLADPPGATLVGPIGEVPRIRFDAGADPWPPGWDRSIAADPTARMPLP